jgi:patatin-like phospholipase/acyl hydrolase
VLSLLIWWIFKDGGGVKGLTPLLILERIFTEIKNQSGETDIPDPCDYFDLIGGTSTGGYGFTSNALIHDSDIL